MLESHQLPATHPPTDLLGLLADRVLEAQKKKPAKKKPAKKKPAKKKPAKRKPAKRKPAKKKPAKSRKKAAKKKPAKSAKTGKSQKELLAEILKKLNKLEKTGVGVKSAQCGPGT